MGFKNNFQAWQTKVYISSSESKIKLPDQFGDSIQGLSDARPHLKEVKKYILR